jgi:putative ABC transport system ATP-binding protein
MTSVTDLGAEAARQHRDFRADSLIVCDRLARIYAAPGGIEVQALQGLDLLVDRGELAALVGASGSGKSTLMNILADLDRPTAGLARVAGHDLGAMSAGPGSATGGRWSASSGSRPPRTAALPDRTAERGAATAAGRGCPTPEPARAAELLTMLGLGHGLDRRPDQLPGGEQQRTAIAMALANEPEVLLADEPTGELEPIPAGTANQRTRPWSTWCWTGPDGYSCRWR